MSLKNDTIDFEPSLLGGANQRRGGSLPDLSIDNFLQSVKANPLANDIHLNFCTDWLVLTMLWWREHQRVGWTDEYFLEKIVLGEKVILQQMLLPVSKKAASIFKRLGPFTITEETEELVITVMRDQRCVEALYASKRSNISLYDLIITRCAPVVTNESVQCLQGVSVEQALIIILRWIRLLNENEQNQYENLDVLCLNQMLTDRLLRRKEPEITMSDLGELSISVDVDFNDRYFETLLHCISVFLCGSTINMVRVQVPSQDVAYSEFIGSKVEKYFERSEFIEIIFPENPYDKERLILGFISTIKNL